MNVYLLLDVFGKELIYDGDHESLVLGHRTRLQSKCKSIAFEEYFSVVLA